MKTQLTHIVSSCTAKRRMCGGKQTLLNETQPFFVPMLLRQGNIKFCKKCLSKVDYESIQVRKEYLV